MFLNYCFKFSFNGFLWFFGELVSFFREFLLLFLFRSYFGGYILEVDIFGERNRVTF